MLLGKAKQNKVINDALLTKKSIDSQWNRTFKLYKEGKLTLDVLTCVMGMSNIVDKKIIEEYGLKVFISTFNKEKGWFLN